MVGLNIQIFGQVIFKSNLGFVNLYNPVPNKFYSAIDTPVSFLIGFSNSISAARSAGVSIIGFNTLITNDFSVNTTI